MKMQGHSTKANSMMLVPPLSQTPPETGNTTTSRKRVKKMDDDTNCESLNMERERRSKMAQMFTQLRTTVPGVLPQATREVIINETIKYIKELEKKKQKLEEMKESKKGVEEGKHGDGNNMNCSITVSANVAFFGIQSLPRPGLVTLIMKVFHDHQSEVLAANVSVNNGNLILAITALVQNGVVENIKREIMSL